MKTIKFTRNQYLNKECSHSEYYAQFVNEATKSNVLRYIANKKTLIAAILEDKNLNNIPLQRWDSCPCYLDRSLFVQAGDFITKAGSVCVLKEAARQIINN